MKRLLAMGVALALGGRETAGVHFGGGCRRFFADGASLSADEFALHVPDHCCGVPMTRGGCDMPPFVTLEAEVKVTVRTLRVFVLVGARLPAAWPLWAMLRGAQAAPAGLAPGSPGSGRPGLRENGGAAAAERAISSDHRTHARPSLRIAADDVRGFAGTCGVTLPGGDA